MEAGRGVDPTFLGFSPRYVKSDSLARGYNAAHRRLRQALAPLVIAGLATCARCGQEIRPGESWDLGHSDDRTFYNGPEHQYCNRARIASQPRKRSRRW